jgi:hypothetical protein
MQYVEYKIQNSNRCICGLRLAGLKRELSNVQYMASLMFNNESTHI